MIPALPWLVGGMAVVYLVAKKRHGMNAGGGSPVVAPTAATPQVPEINAARVGAAPQGYYPSGFLSQTTGPTSASPNKANTNPSGMSVPSTGPSMMERAVMVNADW